MHVCEQKPFRLNDFKLRTLLNTTNKIHSKQLFYFSYTQKIQTTRHAASAFEVKTDVLIIIGAI